MSQRRRQGKERREPGSFKGGLHGSEGRRAETMQELLQANLRSSGTSQLLKRPEKPVSRGSASQLLAGQVLAGQVLALDC